MRSLALVAALVVLAACTSADQRATTEVLRDLNKVLVPIGAIAGGR